eukprot:scaffold76607_cov94-Phaeocystis_antarctica.AAC.1
MPLHRSVLERCTCTAACSVRARPATHVPNPATRHHARLPCNPRRPRPPPYACACAYAPQARTCSALPSTPPPWPRATRTRA